MTTRTYRLAPRDTTGWFLGLQGPQVLAAGSGLVLAAVLAAQGAHPAAACAPAVLGTVAAFVRWHGQPVLDVVPIVIGMVARRLLGRHRWFSPLTPSRNLPPFLAGQEILAVASGPLARWSGTEVGMAVDRRARRWSATLRVSGAGFLLADPAEQERCLALWGDTLATSCRDASPVQALRLTVSTSGVDADDPDLGPIRTTKRAAHLTVVVRARGGDHDETIDAVLGEIALVAERLAAAGLPATVLCPAALAAVVRGGFDPVGDARRPKSLAERASVGPASLPGPLAVAEDWAHVRIDDSAHRAYWVAEWPRIGLPSAWLSGLLLADGPTFTLAVWLEPVPRMRSRRAVERHAAKLTSDEEQRSKAGFRVGADLRRQSEALDEREAELVAGHPELAYTGVVVVSADDSTVLATDAAHVVDAAAAAGMELRPLHGRHLAALGAVLALPRGMRSRGGV